MAQQQQPAAIVTANPPTPTESVVTKPSSFDGSLTSYHGWRRSLSLYMAFNASKFPDDATKVACALACMTSGSATNWAQAYFEGHLDANGDFMAGTWADFVQELDATFKDHNLQQKAMESLLQDRGDVDKDGPEAFFANYEVNARNAGIPAGTTVHDAVHINNLRRMMPNDLRNRIDYMPAAPTTYATYKSAALRLYAAYKELKDRQATFRASQRATTTATATATTPRSTPTSAGQRANSSNTRPRLSQEERERRRAGGLCYICRSSTHLLADCPQNKTRDEKPHMRVAISEEPASDKAAEIATLRARIQELEGSQQGF